MKDLKNLITTILILTVIAVAAYLTSPMWLPKVTRIIPQGIVTHSGTYCDTSQPSGMQSWQSGNDCSGGKSK